MNAVNALAEPVTVKTESKVHTWGPWDAVRDGHAVISYPKLRAALADLLTRADGLLGGKGALVSEAGMEELYSLYIEVHDRAEELTLALAALEVVDAIGRALCQRAAAVQEVAELPYDWQAQFGSPAARGVHELLAGYELPERWRRLWPEPMPLSDEDIPY